MLVLTRRPGESFMIGDDVTITILGIQNKKVRVGVSAPEKTLIYREEIFLRLQEEKRAIKTEVAC